MTTVDLITGFLGAGKTTFIRGYAEACKRRGERVIIIENEFGKANIDASLLRGLEDDHCDIEQLTGACICCGGEQKFKNLLFTFSSCGYDRIIVEPSGIYDVATFFEVLDNEPVSRWCEIGSIIAVADAGGHSETGTAAALMQVQLRAAGEIILSKVQLTDEQTIDETIKAIFALGCTGVVRRDWAGFRDEDYERFSRCGYKRSTGQRIPGEHDTLFSAVTFHPVYADANAVREAISAMMRGESEYGDIYRVKGYVLDEAGNAYEVNCTRSLYSVEPAVHDRSVLTVISDTVRS